MIFTYMKTEVNVLFLHLYHEVLKYIFRQSLKSLDKSFTFSNLYNICNLRRCRYVVVKLREREGQRVDLGMSLKGHL